MEKQKGRYHVTCIAYMDSIVHWLINEMGYNCTYGRSAWSCQASAELRLLSCKPGVAPHARSKCCKLRLNFLL